MIDEDFDSLVRSARSGDPAAASRLLSRFEPEVRTMVRVRLPRSLRNQFDSMDFVQAVWKSVFTGEPAEDRGFRDAGQFRGFLAGVARNKVYEELRRRSTKKYDIGREERLYVRRGEREVPRDVASPEPTPSENVQADDRLGQILQGRSEDEARVIALRRQGLTYQEIADQVGWNERAVRRLIEEVRSRMEARKWR